MSFRPDHELHRRRWSRNLGLGAVLAAFVAVIFALTIVKVSRQDDQGNPPGQSQATAPQAVLPQAGQASPSTGGQP